MTPDVRFMQMALELAARARGRTRPNPMVGAVLVRNGQVIGCGFHTKAGQPHAEIEALRNCGDTSPAGATLYVNLEPCSHTGRTGPCTEALIQAGIRRVVLGVQDPDPRVNGRGIARLQEAGIKVEVGLLEDQCKALNAPFFTTILHGRPMVSIKVAASLDARIATRTGDARWLSSKEARRWAHQLRDQVDAILVGANTVIADDPSLTVRLVKGRDPIRIVLDSHLRTPLSSKLYQPPLAQGTWIATTQTDPARTQPYLERGIDLLTLPPNPQGRVDLNALLHTLKQRGLLQILVEGGGEVHGAFLKTRTVDQIWLILTPWLLGEDGRPAFRIPGTDRLADALQFQPLQASPLGPDLLIEAVPIWPEKEPAPCSQD